MKKITLILSLLLCVLVSACQQKQVNVSPYRSTIKTKGDFCILISETARSVVTARQLGVPIEQIDKKIKAKKRAMTTADEIVALMIIDAYSNPIQRTSAGKAKAINNFANKHLNMCKRALK